MIYQCMNCFELGDGRTFSEPDTGLCDRCKSSKDSLESKIRGLIGPNLSRTGQSEVGDLARAIRDILDSET